MSMTGMSYVPRNVNHYHNIVSDVSKHADGNHECFVTTTIDAAAAT